MYSKDLTPRAELAVFFAASFLIAWGSWIPAFRSAHPSRLLAFIGLFAPAISALLVAAFADGARGVAEILGRFRKWRVGARWYAIALVLLPALFLIAAWLGSRIGHRPVADLWVRSPVYFLVAAFGWLMFINSGEEIGWRGFALPRLLASFRSPVIASLFLGIVWGLWHLPLYLVPGQSSFPFPLFLLLTTSLSFLYTLLSLESGGSLLLACILHASTDIAPRFLQIAKFDVRTWWILDGLVWIAAAACLPRLRRRPVGHAE